MTSKFMIIGIGSTIIAIITTLGFIWNANALEWNISNQTLNIDIGDTLPANGSVTIPVAADAVNILNMTKFPPDGVYVLIQNSKVIITNKPTELSTELIFPSNP
jgi:hypothetical protein